MIMHYYYFNKCMIFFAKSSKYITFLNMMRNLKLHAYYPDRMEVTYDFLYSLYKNITGVSGEKYL